MRQWMRLLGFLFSAALLLTACSGEGAPADAAGAGAVNIRIESSPDPITMGDATITLVITDKNSAPIEGARVDVSVEHTDMSGMSMSGPATGQAGGKYAISANFSMSGNWKMTVYVRTDSLDYREEFDLKIK